MPREDQVPKWRKVNGTQLANIIGVTPSRISHLANAGMPRIEDSKLYDLAQVVPWLTQRSMEKGDVQGSGSARQLYFEAMTERAQIETEKLKGNVYGRAEVEQFVMGLSVMLREHIIALPERVTRDRTIAAKFDIEIQDALSEVAAAVTPWIENGEAGARLIDAPAKPKRNRVGKRQPANAARKPRTRKVSL